MLPLSHDEVVHGKCSLLSKMPGDAWQQLANLRLLYGFMYGHPGKKLLFMGAELAQWEEWNHQGELHWHLLDDESHRGVYRWLGDLNRLYRRCPALHRTDAYPEGFEWIDCADSAQSIAAFVRWAESEKPLIFVCNFTPRPPCGLPARAASRRAVPRGAQQRRRNLRWQRRGPRRLGANRESRLPWAAVFGAVASTAAGRVGFRA